MGDQRQQASTESMDDNNASKEYSLDQVDSEDITFADKEPFFRSLFNRMLPGNCLQPATDAITECSTVAYKSCLASEREELDWILPSLLKDIKAGSKHRTAALQRLFKLMDRDHQQNRVPAVCTTKYHTVLALVQCLDKQVCSSDRRQTLLILNNLCIPAENKAAILFGEPGRPLLNALLFVIRSKFAESYLAFVTLLNLSYLQDDRARTAICTFEPDPDIGEEARQYRHYYENHFSLLRIMEKTLLEYSPYIQHQNSVEEQCCRWCINVIRNLVLVRDNAIIIASKTQIPYITAQLLVLADTDNMKKWTYHSIYDASIMMFVHLCNHDECVDEIIENERIVGNLHRICEKLSVVNGIQQYRAIALLKRIEMTESTTRSIGFSV